MSKIRRFALMAPVTFALAVGGAAQATEAPTNIPDSLRDRAATEAARDLLVHTDEVLNSITYTTYSTLGVWKPWSGVYKVVCSRFVTELLEEALPEKLDQILDEFPGQSLLGVWDYYHFFRDIPYGSTRHGWRRIEEVTDLRPGDLIVWRYTDDSPAPSWGHVVVVAGVPARDDRWSNAYRVRVADSSRSAHSNDNRCSSCTGLGAGEMLLRASSTSGRITNLAWSLDGHWRNDLVGIAMARPAD